MKTQEIIDLCNAELECLADGSIRPTDKLGSAADAFTRIRDAFEKTITIGERVNQLVDRFGGYSTGIYVLEMALTAAVTGNRDKFPTVTIGGKLISEYERVREIRRHEADILNDLKKQGLI